MRKSKFILLVFIWGVAPFYINAQKLPKVQQVSLYAPANIKIDGNANEWGGKFQAYNVSNRIYYTIANDANYLYLILQAADDAANEKALFGITFTIKEKTKNNVSVTYPIQTEVLKQEPLRNAVRIIKRLTSDTAKNAKRKIDSLRLFTNKGIGTVFKLINVNGISSIQEPSISIYNTENIKVNALLDNNIRYTYELAIPLNFLDISIRNGQKFNYNIRMNGIPDVALNGAPTPIVDGPTNGPGIGIDNAYVSYPTDLSGEYTLAK